MSPVEMKTVESTVNELVPKNPKSQELPTTTHEASDNSWSLRYMEHSRHIKKKILKDVPSEIENSPQIEQLKTLSETE